MFLQGYNNYITYTVFGLLIIYDILRVINRLGIASPMENLLFDDQRHLKYITDDLKNYFSNVLNILVSFFLGLVILLLLIIKTTFLFIGGTLFLPGLYFLVTHYLFGFFEENYWYGYWMIGIGVTASIFYVAISNDTIELFTENLIAFSQGGTLFAECKCVRCQLPYSISRLNRYSWIGADNKKHSANICYKCQEGISNNLSILNRYNDNEEYSHFNIEDKTKSIVLALYLDYIVQKSERIKNQFTPSCTIGSMQYNQNYNTICLNTEPRIYLDAKDMSGFNISHIPYEKGRYRGKAGDVIMEIRYRREGYYVFEMKLLSNTLGINPQIVTEYVQVDKGHYIKKEVGSHVEIYPDGYSEIVTEYEKEWEPDVQTEERQRIIFGLPKEVEQVVNNMNNKFRK
jgi:hypothetical protein